MLRSERYYGKLYRAFTLGQDVEESGAQARYADGVLELTLPKKPRRQAKRVTIHCRPELKPDAIGAGLASARFERRCSRLPSRACVSRADVIAPIAR